MPVNSYSICLSTLPQNLSQSEQQTLLLQCLATTLDETITGVNVHYLIYAASLVFFMQAGFAMLCAGSVRWKNLQNTMLKNVLDSCGASVGFYTVGFAFAWGGTSLPSGSTGSTDGGVSFIGNENFFLMDVEALAFWLFQFSFAATSATIVAGTLAERCQMVAYLCYSVALTAFVYPIVVRSIWSSAGFLSSYKSDPILGVGVVDFSGSLVVHTTGGLTALIATYILGARTGRFYEVNGKKCVNNFPGHSMALKALGVFILWFGWYGFTVGSTYYITSSTHSFLAKNAAVNTTLAAAGGTITALFIKAYMIERDTGEVKFSLSDALNGCLSGLVSITGGAAFVHSWAAITTGFIAGTLYIASSHLLIRFQIDDAVDAIPVHMMCGIWGAISVGLFAVPEYLKYLHPSVEVGGWFYNIRDGSLLAANLIGISFVVAWVSMLMVPFFALLHYVGWLRADSLEEIVGLDISYHGADARANALTDEEESNRQHYLDAYYERKQQRRQTQRGNLRHRVMWRNRPKPDGGTYCSDNNHVNDSGEGEQHSVNVEGVGA